MTPDIKFYLRLMSRRLLAMMALFLLASGIGFVVALRMPTIYTTSAKLLVEDSQISDRLVDSTFETNRSEQLDLVQQRLMTRANLLDVAREQRVFGNAGGASPDEIVEKMRNLTNIRSISGRSRATVMTIGFTSEDPRKAAAVVNQYVTKVLSTSAGFRAQRAEGTLEFFQQEAERLSRNLDIQSQKIVEFKNANANALPENLTYHQGRQTLLQERLSRAERDLEALKSQRANIERLYASAGALRPSDIPQTPQQRTLQNLEGELQAALGIYSEQNPKVKLLRNRVELLKGQITGSATTSDGDETQPISPLQVNLAEMDARIATLTQEISSTSATLERLEESISSTPANRITLEAMERELENIRNLYSSATKRLAQAQMGERIELSSKGERITVLESANVPVIPSGPNRVKTAGLGMMVGMGLAAGLFVLLEFLNQSIRRPEDIVSALKITPLATLPRFETAADRRRRRHIQLLMLVGVSVAVVGSLWAIDTYYMPLDQLFQKVVDRLT